MLAMLIRPFVAASTYRRWVFLILGGLLALPYLSVATMVLATLLQRPEMGLGWPAPLVVTTQVAFVAVTCVATALIPATRRLEGIAARELLGLAELEVEDSSSWSQRGRTVLWFVLHLCVGTLIGFLTLSVPPLILVLLLSPVLPPPVFTRDFLSFASDVGEFWLPVAGVVLFVAGYYLVAATGEIFARLAPGLLGTSEQQRLRQRVEQLSERNRLASELHDSIGHTLGVVTLQAGAAARVLDSDPAFARRALRAIEESARGAQEGLDHVLGALRDGTESEPLPGTLADLDRLVYSTQYAGLSVRVEGDLGPVPATVSREAYRTIREGLTNALRHAGEVAVDIRMGVRDGCWELEMTNPLGPVGPPARASGGVGISGIRRRVGALGGSVTASAEGDQWLLKVRLPVRSIP